MGIVALGGAGGGAFGGARDVALGLRTRRWKYDIALGAAVGGALSVAFGMAVDVAGGLAVDVAGGLALGVV